MIKKLFLNFAIFFAAAMFLMTVRAFGESGQDCTDIVVLSTTDIHGKCWDTNVLTNEAIHNNMLRVSTAVNRIREEYGAVHLVCGHDFTFGWRGEGNPRRLREYCEREGLGWDVMPEVRLDGSAVSSTRIRALLTEGRLEEANRLLGHPHVLTGEVCHGRHLGSTIGFPTANLLFAPGVLVPAHGVYAGRLEIEGETEPKYAVTNIGVRPTVDDSDRVTVESYILDYSADLYGKQIRLEFLEFIRPERKFASLEELTAQIGKDAERVRRYIR